MPAETPPADAAALIGRLIVDYRAAKALFLACELDLFRALDPTGGTAAAAARSRGLDPRATEILLDALAGLGLLRKRGGSYRLTPSARERLHPDSPRSLSANLRYQERLSGAYAELVSAVKTGRPRRGLTGWIGLDDGFLSDYMAGMRQIAVRPAAEIAGLLDLGRASDMLDVGGGHGMYSLALLDRNPRLRATVLDLPETLELTKTSAARHPSAGRLVLRPGDYRRATFGRDAFDLILLSHVTHDESPEANRSLLEKARAALRPGGRVVIHDFMLDSGRTAPLFGALFSLHMLAYTTSGRAYSEREYREWLATSGFSPPRRFPICRGAPNESVLLSARKRGRR